MKSWGFLCALVCGLCVFSAIAQSQESANDLRIKLNGIDGAPVKGALVALLNAKDSIVAEGLSTESGVRVLRAKDGVYRVRVRRIGYLPFVSSAVSLPRAGDLALSIESPRVVLAQIVVNSKSQCKRNGPNSAALSSVWDEIDKALRSSQLTMDDLSGIGRAYMYKREVGANGVAISSDTSIFAINNNRPFGAIDPAVLIRDGFVVGDERKGWQVFGPDETVLLSEQFGATHCFQLARQRDRPGEIGVSFEPIPHRELTDIEGVLWVDQATSQLREIQFRFVNAGALTWYKAGGFTRFRQVPSGTWIVDEWQLVVPRLEIRKAPPLPEQYVAIGYVHNGGGILAPELATERHRTPAVDSAARKP